MVRFHDLTLPERCVFHKKSAKKRLEKRIEKLDMENDVPEEKGAGARENRRVPPSD